MQAVSFGCIFFQAAVGFIGKSNGKLLKRETHELCNPVNLVSRVC